MTKHLRNLSYHRSCWTSTSRENFTFYLPTDMPDFTGKLESRVLQCSQQHSRPSRTSLIGNAKKSTGFDGISNFVWKRLPLLFFHFPGYRFQQRHQQHTLRQRYSGIPALPLLGYSRQWINIANVSISGACWLTPPRPSSSASDFPAWNQEPLSLIDAPS